MSTFYRRCHRDKPCLTKIQLQLFAEEEKTERATPHRRKEAREKGQVFHSNELTAATGLLIATSTVYLLAPWWRQQFIMMINTVYGLTPLPDFGAAEAIAIVNMSLSTVMRLLAPLFLAVIVAGIAINLAQIGFVFSTEPLSFRPDRLNPVAGFQRILSRRSIANLIRNIIKLVLVVGVAYRSLKSSHYLLLKLPLMGTLQFGSILASISWGLIWQCCTAIFFLAIADYAYQRWEYEKSLSMSVQDIKEEFRQMEGSPEIRAKIRERQRRMAYARMMTEVPKADVIITNPTHYAVALKYDSVIMAAPKVVAKGAGLVAQRIGSIARQNGVMVMENKVLTRAIFQSVEIGDTIPSQFYQAVAEILAFVYESRGLV